MNLSKYARIGKSPFIKAIGIQENYKKVIYIEDQELDRIASGCFSCENYRDIEYLDFLPAECQAKACLNCDNCPHAVYKKITKESYQYVNEKNMYGYKPRLKPIALKLMLIYHFSDPDERGLVKGLSPKELASMLHCTVRSIKNANQTLQQYGYIYCSEDPMSKKRFQIFLTEYETYHLPAEQGGRGYATFNQESLMEFINMKDINQLRILLRAALELDTEKQEDKPIIFTNDYDSLRRFLPTYCKPGVIRKALSSATSMFQVVFKDEFVHLKMNEDFHGRRAYEKGSLKYSMELESYITAIDEKLNRLNQNTISHKPIDEKEFSYVREEGFDAQISTSLKNQLFVPLKLTSEDFRDLGILCETYTLEKVKDIIKFVHKNYTSHFKVQSMGALVRTVLRNNLKFEEIASLFNPA